MASDQMTGDQMASDLCYAMSRDHTYVRSYRCAIIQMCDISLYLEHLDDLAILGVF